MHKFIASLLLTLAAVVLLSSAAVSSYPVAERTLTMRVVRDGALLGESTRPAAAGRYIDVGLDDGMLVSARLTGFEYGVASIDAVVARGGLTLAEPSVSVTEEESASIELASLPLTLEFALR